MDGFRDRVAVVVGGHDGIGGAIALRLAEAGATVYATSRRADVGVTAHGAGAIRHHRVDAADVPALAAFFDAVRGEARRVDVLVFSAGVSEFATLDAVGEEHFDRAFDLNTRSLLFATQAATAIMPDGGAVVLVGSIAGGIGTRGYGVYNATKAAVRSFARTWANELAPRRIRVNVVSPGPTDTAMFAAASDEVRETLTRLIPLGRMGRADEVAAAALFLAGDGASFITGVDLPVDGGMAQV